jgi:hypothetical protein
MKKLSILAVLVVMAGFLTAATSDLPKDTAGGNNTVVVKNGIYLPYAATSSVTMEKVYSKDEYVLWKCPARLVKNFPGKSITGKSFNYFVYKNGEFHLTVTEMNKESVYQFFSE